MLAEKTIIDAENIVNQSIMPNDHMYHAANPKHYFGVGRSAMRCIAAGMEAAHTTQAPKRILDFACGSGRVTRWLRAVFPNSIIVCSDLREDSLQFLKNELDVEPHISDADFNKITFEKPFDLIWCGSLLTHLPQESCQNFLSAARRWISTRGIAVVTTHGREVAKRLALPTQKYVRSVDAPKVLEGFETGEFGYVDYVNRKGIGFSVSTPELISRMADKADLRTLLVQERGWDNHQDALTFARKV
jgi:2-polyprenyl-3-methyl-5-hydroxy-6-metoxy-1,4-benzoquinol methylase